MLSWIFGRKTSAAKLDEQRSASIPPNGESVASAPTPARSMPPSSARKLDPDAPQQVPADLPDAATPLAAGATAAASRLSGKLARDLMTKSAAALKKPADTAPAPGMPVAVVSRSRVDIARLIRVQAGGRLVLAEFPGRHTQLYSRRSDGAYWLAGAAEGASSRLVLGVTPDLNE